MPNFVTTLELVVAGAFSRELNALFLRFDGDKLRAGQSPRGDHSDGSDSAAQVQDSFGPRRPGRPIPGGQNVVGGKSMAFFQLEQTKISADRVERLAGLDFQVRG